MTLFETGGKDSDKDWWHCNNIFKRQDSVNIMIQWLRMWNVEPTIEKSVKCNEISWWLEAKPETD